MFITDSEYNVFARIAKAFPNLIEISGKNIDIEGLRALGRLNGSSLSSIKFDFVAMDVETSLDMAIGVLCKGNPHLKLLHLLGPSEFDSTGILTDAAFQSIVQYCPYIESISLKQRMNITDQSITYLTQLLCLKEITLSNINLGQLTSAGVQGLLMANRKLESLDLTDIDVSDFPEERTPDFIDNALLSCIGLHCPSLVKLHMKLSRTSSGVTGASFEAMVNGLRALEELSFSAYYNKSNAIVPMLGISCPLLKVVEIEHVECTDDDIAVMCRGCPLLESLELNHLHNITDTSILSIASHCRLLKHFQLIFVDHITDNSLCMLFASCIHLTSVTLFGMKLITDESLIALFSNCRKLQDLTLISCPNLTDYCIVALPVYCPLIRNLELWAIHTLSHETLVQLSRYCKHIQTMNIHNCNQINNNTVIEILSNCKQLYNFRMYSKNIQINEIFKQQCDELTLCKSYRKLNLIYSKFEVESI